MTTSATPPIEQISASELQARIGSGQPFELVDVRTETERQIASIAGAKLLDEAYYRELLALDRDTPIVFHCHHGIRSQQAAEHFQSHGFRRLANVVGGIDAWSLQVDPSVPRY